MWREDGREGFTQGNTQTHFLVKNGEAGPRIWSEILDILSLLKKISMLNLIKIVQYIEYYNFSITKHQNQASLPISTSKFLWGTVEVTGRTSVHGC